MLSPLPVYTDLRLYIKIIIAIISRFAVVYTLNMPVEFDRHINIRDYINNYALTQLNRNRYTYR